MTAWNELQTTTYNERHLIQGIIYHCVDCYALGLWTQDTILIQFQNEVSEIQTLICEETYPFVTYRKKLEPKMKTPSEGSTFCLHSGL